MIEQNKRTKKEYEALIEDEHLNSYRVSLHNQTPEQPKHILQYKYDKLLYGKIEDKQILADIKQYANQIIRHRISATLICRNITQPKETCSAEIVGILPEEEQFIQNYFIGLTVFSNQDWQNKLTDFKEEMNQQLKGVISARPVVSPTTTIQITNAILSVQFK